MKAIDYNGWFNYFFKTYLSLQHFLIFEIVKKKKVLQPEKKGVHNHGLIFLIYFCIPICLCKIFILIKFFCHCLGQVLFLELRKIEQLEEEGVFEVNWLMGLLRELMEFMFIWVSENKEILATEEENVSSQTDEAKQVFISFSILCRSMLKE